MPDTIVSTQEDSCCYIINTESLKLLFELTETVLNKKIQKLIRADDRVEIKNELVFQQLLNSCKHSDSDLCLIAITEVENLKENSNACSMIEEDQTEYLLTTQEDKLNFNHEVEKRKLDKKKQELEIEFQRLLLETEVNLKTCDLRKLEEKEKKLKHKKANVSQLYYRLRDAEKVDVCFLIDVTGSMSEYFDEVRMTIGKINNNLNERFGNFKLRCSLIGYRDHDDGENNRIIKLQFTDRISQFESFSKQVKCFGGGDQCEDVFGGLEEVGKLNWSSSTRLLIHIADAPCHGKRFHLNALDDYPDNDPRGLKIENLLKAIKDLEINYFFIQINESTSKMIGEFNKEFELMNSNLIETFKLTSIHDIATFVQETIEITVTKMKMVVQKEELRHYEIVELPPVWDKSCFNHHKCMYIVAAFSGDLSNIKNSKINYEYIESDVWMTNKPFAKGELRYAFAGMLSIGLTDEGENVLLNSVIKDSVFTSPKYNSIEYHKDIVEIQVIARYLAKEFTKAYKSEQKLYIININLLLISDLNRYFTIEEFVEGDFYKWSNNNGYVDESIYASTLDAFSHWTYNVTGYLMVVDLQGFKFKNKEFILTDPVILCPSEPDRYTNTNLGEEGVKAFFEKHRCNNICRKLNLIKEVYQSLEDRRE